MIGSASDRFGRKPLLITRVDTADGLVPALEAASGAGGVHLATVPVDYSENQRALVEELRDLAPASPTA